MQPHPVAGAGGQQRAVAADQQLAPTGGQEGGRRHPSRLPQLAQG